MKTFALHSYKGGTGKTTLGANIAALFAQKGKKVAMLDLDFQAPSLHTLFGITPRTAYLNDFLSEKASYEEVLTDLTDSLKTKGKIIVGFSQPSVEAIREQLARDRKWHMQAISQLLVMKQKLEEDQFDYMILDSAPGVHYSSVNAIVASDFTIIVAKIDNFDFDTASVILAETSNVPAEIIIDPEIRDAKRKAVAEAMQQQNQMDSAAQVADTAKTAGEINPQLVENIQGAIPGGV